MNIFINTISSNWIIFLFNNEKKIIDKITTNFKQNESSKLIPLINEILEKNSLTINNLENLIVVNWPWSFTGIRSTILVINSINFLIKKNITTLSFFDLYENFPIIKTSSKRDNFIKKNKDKEIEIINNEELEKFLTEKKIKKIYWEINKNLFENIEEINNIDYEKIIKNLKFNNLKIAQSNYIKKPSIT